MTAAFAMTAHTDQAPPVESLLARQAHQLSSKLQAHRMQLFPPNARKELRKFSSSEAGKLLGVNDGYLRRLSLEGRGPAVDTSASGRRLYSLTDIQELREYLDAGGKGDRQYIPRRKPSESLVTLAVSNFKGGSGKTTTAAHLAQYLALHGYRVLAIDLDPQASLSALHGIQPEFDVTDDNTLYGAIRFTGNPRPLKDIIRKTYFPNLNLVPGNIELMEFEHETPKALQTGAAGPLFFTRIAQVIATVEDSYDAVIIDCP